MIKSIFTQALHVGCFTPIANGSRPKEPTWESVRGAACWLQPMWIFVSKHFHMINEHQKQRQLFQILVHCLPHYRLPLTPRVLTQLKSVPRDMRALITDRSDHLTWQTFSQLVPNVNWRFFCDPWDMRTEWWPDLTAAPVNWSSWKFAEFALRSDMERCTTSQM